MGPSKGHLPANLLQHRLLSPCVCKAVSLIFSIHLIHLLLLSRFFFIFKSVVTGVLPPSLMGLASSGSVCELADIGAAGHGESIWHLVPEATPAASPGLCFCQANRMHFGKNTLPNQIQFKLILIFSFSICDGYSQYVPGGECISRT